MRQILAEEAVRAQLAELPGWALDGKAIVRTYQFKDFAEAMVFVNRAAELAEEADHHPDIDIRYNKVRLSLSTHDAGGITRADIALAKLINAL